MRIILLTSALLTAVALLPLSAQEETKTGTVASAAAPVSAPDLNEPVARVNGKPIPRKKLDSALRAAAMQLARQGRPVQRDEVAQLKLDVLEEIIGRELVLQESGTESIPDLDGKVQTEIVSVRTRMGGPEEFANALKQEGITEAEYISQVRENILLREKVQQIVDRELSVTAEDVRAFYDQNPELFIAPETVRASHILIRVPTGASDEVKADKRSQIEAVHTLLDHGDDFAEVAKKFSEDTGSRDSGGDLGYFPRGSMVAEFDAVAFSLPTNQVSDIVTTQFGYHILKVADRKPSHPVTFEEAKERIERVLRMRKSEEIRMRHVKNLRATANVEILLRPQESSSTPTVAPTKATAPAVESKPVATPNP